MNSIRNCWDLLGNLEMWFSILFLLFFRLDCLLPAYFTKLLVPLKRKWRGQGITNFIFIDDGWV